MLPKTTFIEAMAKHLPPSASQLHLLDVGGEAGLALQVLRPDIAAVTASLDVRAWMFADDSVDAVVAYDTALTPVLLAHVLRVMRPGGRFILVHPAGEVNATIVQTLEKAGYTRILVEAAAYHMGVLIRGEKPHTTGDTLARVQLAAGRDANTLDLAAYRGRFVHLLIQQTPNKPVWRLTPDEKIEWHAITAGEAPALLAFTSLPKAVHFMQQAVLRGIIRDVNKVAKFSKITAQAWSVPVLLNPALDDIQPPITLLAVDPATAEKSDE
jgi:hypothetical protein